MSTGSTTTRRMRVWPAVVAPLGMTLLLGIAVWLFLSKVASDQRAVEDETRRLESYARHEVADLAARASFLADAYIDERVRQRTERERNIQVELRGVSEAVRRALDSILEKSRATVSAPSDVSDFPAGFEGLKILLEMEAAPRTGDSVLSTLQAHSTELSALLPAGCSFSLIEDSSVGFFSVANGPAPENARIETMGREYAWEDGENSRRWTLQVSLSETDDLPAPDARTAAARISDGLSGARLDGLPWRGWLVDAGGEAVASFPVVSDAASETTELPPYLDIPGEWIEIEGRRLIFQERGPALKELGLVPAVAVAMDTPPPPLDIQEEFWKDKRWNLTLGLLALLSAGLWGWFVRALVVSRGAAAARSERAPAPAPAHSRATEARTGNAPRQRLVRDASAARRVPEVQGVIVADINDDGEVVVEAELHQAPLPPRPRMVIPTGSLLRLQERHRGGRGRQGSRVLDHARSQLLRELANRVRPVTGAASPHADAEGGGRASSRVQAGKLQAMRQVDGWEKIAE